MNILAPTILVLLLAGDPQSATPLTATMAGHHPSWVRRPSGTDLANLYPRGALERGISGHAVIECTVNADGMLDVCHVVSEDPPGQGFGDATLRLKSKFKMHDDAGIAPGAKIMIPVSWSVG